MKIRAERPADTAAIRAVNIEAFGRALEADLIDSLRVSGVSILSLVAESGAEIVGHILFTPVRVDDGSGGWPAAALGPMAVRPDRQQQGIGSALVRNGLEICARQGDEIVFVLGHPAFYPRFGFKPAAPLGLLWEHPVPEPVFMVLELAGGALAGRTGIVRYHPAFNGV